MPKSCTDIFTHTISNKISSNTATATITTNGTTNGIKAAPTLDLNGLANSADYAATFTQHGDPVKIVALDLDITNPKNNIIKAIITLTNYQTGDKFIVGDLPAGFTATSGNTSGALTLTLSATSGTTSEIFQDALSAITYRNTIYDDPDTRDKIIIIQLTDSGNLTSTVQLTTILVELDMAQEYHVIPVTTLMTNSSATAGARDIWNNMDDAQFDATDADVLRFPEMPPLTATVPRSGRSLWSGRSHQ